MSERIQLVLETLGALGTVCTLLGALLPKGSTAGYWFAKVGADLKGHTKKASDGGA